jgi:hypothetical protein
MEIKRKEDWERRLHDFLEERSRVPFAWGTNDCALFVADAVNAVTGVDLGADCRGKYSTEEEAIEAMRKMCGAGDVAAFAAHVCHGAGMPRRDHVNFAQRGDVVILENPDGSHSVGVVGLNGLHAWFVTEGGLRRARVRDCVSVWKVG